VLEKRIVRASLRRGAEGVAPVGVGGEQRPIPLLDRVRRIGEDDVELLQLVALEEPGFGERVAALDPKVWIPCRKRFMRAIEELMRLSSWP
jgi:hypothetical protein